MTDKAKLYGIVTKLPIKSPEQEEQMLVNILDFYDEDEIEDVLNDGYQEKPDLYVLEKVQVYSKEKVISIKTFTLDSKCKNVNIGFKTKETKKNVIKTKKSK